MPTQHRVRQGDCISSIAFASGFHWQILWQHPENAELNQRRQDPNMLLTGDLVQIPERTPKQEVGATEQRHRFRMLGVPAKLKLRLLVNDEPRANEPYQLNLDGRWEEGRTDAEGYLQTSIHPAVTTGQLVVGSGSLQDTYPLSFGTLDPIDTDSGVDGRLKDLGYDADADRAGSIRAFQAKEGLAADGLVDEATRTRLKDSFGQ